MNKSNNHLKAALGIARNAINALSQEGVAVLAVMAHKRRPLLLVDRMPQGVVSGIKRRYPNGVGGTTIVRATDWQGCQLEAMHDELPRPERVRQCGRALEVVRG